MSDSRILADAAMEAGVSMMLTVRIYRGIRAFLVRTSGYAAVLMLAISCSWFEARPLSSIPLQSTAGDQFGYALHYRGRNNPELLLNDSRFYSSRKIIREHFQMVVDHFPDDREFTPAARFQMAVMDAGLDFPNRIKPRRSALRNSIEEFKQIARDYSKVEIIQVDSIYRQGLCYYQIRDYDNAHRCFKLVCDNYIEHQVPEIRSIARTACFNHQKTFVYDEKSSN